MVSDLQASGERPSPELIAARIAARLGGLSWSEIEEVERWVRANPISVSNWLDYCHDHNFAFLTGPEHQKHLADVDFVERNLLLVYDHLGVP